MITADRKQGSELIVPNPMVATQLGKDDLLYRVAHDLKNTLTAAHLTLAKVSLYREKMTDEQVDESVARTMWILNSMAETVTNIVRLNRIEDEVEAVMLDSAEIVPLTKTSIDQINNIAKQKSIAVISDLPEQNMLVQLDPVYYRTIINNMISNAVKFSYPNSEVIVLLKQAGCKAVLSVIDQGQGLTEDDFKILFSQFGKLSARPTAGEASLGLGLYISHRLVTAMNGTIEAHSEGKDKGSRFTVSFDIIGS